MDAPDVNEWIADVRVRPESAGIGMILIHQGIVRGTSRSSAPVRGMTLDADRARLDEMLREACTWTGVITVRGWVNEGALSVGDDIMKVLVPGTSTTMSLPPCNGSYR